MNFLGDAGIGDGQLPCLPIPNPLDYSQWQALPGFDDPRNSPRPGECRSRCCSRAR